MGAATLQLINNSNNLIYVAGVFRKPIPAIHNLCFLLCIAQKFPPLVFTSAAEEQQLQRGNLFDSTRIAENAPVTLRQLHSEPASAASRLTLSAASVRMRQTKEMKKALIFVMRDLNNRTLI